MKTGGFRVSQTRVCRIVKRDSDFVVLEFRVDRITRFAGVVFLILGVGILTSPFWGPLKNDDGSPAPWYLPVLVGLPFAAGGIAFTLLPSSDLVLDRGQRTVARRWRSPLWWLRNVTRSLDEFSSVMISKDISVFSVGEHGSKYEAPTYGLVIYGSSGTMEIFSGDQDYRKVRNLADEISEFVGLPVTEQTAYKEIETSTDAPSKSTGDLTERVRSDHSSPHTPPGNRISVHVMDDELELRLPARQFRASDVPGFIWPLVAALIFNFAVYHSLKEFPLPHNLRWLRIAMQIFAALGGGIVFLHATGIHLRKTAKWTERVVVSPRRLLIHRKSRLGENSVEMSTDFRLDVQLAPNRLSGRAGSQKVIWAVGEDTKTTIGTSLNDEERIWLVEVIRHATALPSAEIE